jgi:uncharacterized protein YukE
MTSFTVTPDELHGLASQLSGLLGEISQATQTVSSGAPGAAQNGDLEGAIGSFLGDWSEGLEQLRTRLDELSSRLQGAADSYLSTDGGIASAFGAR